VIATTRAIVSAGNGGVPGGLVLSRNRPVAPASAKRRCPRQTAGRRTPARPRRAEAARPAPARGPAHADAPGPLRHRQPVRRQQHDLCPLDVLVAGVWLPDDRLAPGPL